MADDGATATKTSGRDLSTLALPKVPPDQPLLHDAIRFRERFDDYIAKRKQARASMSSAANALSSMPQSHTSPSDGATSIAAIPKAAFRCPIYMY